MTRSTSEQEAMLFLSQRLDDLRTLEAKKSQGQLSETDLQEWQNLYKLVVPLYGQRHQQLIEQRRALRIPYRLKLDVVNQSGENFHAMSVDISSTGFALTYIERMKADERVQLRQPFPHSIAGNALNPMSSRLPQRFAGRIEEQIGSV